MTDDAAKADLKPCPFCGHPPIAEPDDSERGSWIMCVRHGEHNSIVFHEHVSGWSDLVKAWNDRAALVPEWRPIETCPKDGTKILRPHVNWGAMAVKMPTDKMILPKGCQWVTVDYATAWPDEAFLPFWMPLPEPPMIDVAVRGEG